MSIAIASSVQGPVALSNMPVGVVSVAIPAASAGVTGKWLIFGKVVIQLAAAGPIPNPTEVDIQLTLPGPQVLDFSRVLMPPFSNAISQSFSLQGTLSSSSSVEVVLFCNAGVSATAQFARLVAISVDQLELAH